jgi:transforming growth factor-beta-induced protein
MGENMTDRVSIIDTLAAEPRFSTFTRYLALTDLRSIFSRPGDFTVFVPTNEAFAKIPDDRMNAMLNEPGRAQLKELLAYHIVPGKIMAANIGSNQVRNSVNGKEIEFADHQGIKVNGAALQARNIDATDGVVHSIGTVLSPQPLAGSRALDSAATPANRPAPPAVAKPLAVSATTSIEDAAAASGAITQKIPASAMAPKDPAAKAPDTAKPIF